MILLMVQCKDSFLISIDPKTILLKKKMKKNMKKLKMGKLGPSKL